VKIIEEQMKRKTLFVLFLFILFESEIMADSLHEYDELLEQLDNYNTLGFFIINDIDSWQRSYILYTDLDIVSLVPYNKGFFQFFDSETGKPVYGRNAILRVNHEGMVVNLDNYPIYPVIKVDIHSSYKLNYRENKLIVEYPQKGIIDEHDIFLYWPEEINNSIFGVYFYFENVCILHDDRVLSGFIDTSSVNIQLTIVKMMKLLSEIQVNNNSVIFGAGSAEAVLAILQSLLTASYTVKADPPIYYSASEEMQKLPGSNIEIPKRGLNTDPLKIAFLYKFLKITLNDMAE
jgi:hypothetical protein